MVNVEGPALHVARFVDKYQAVFAGDGAYRNGMGGTGAANEAIVQVPVHGGRRIPVEGLEDQETFRTTVIGRCVKTGSL